MANFIQSLGYAMSGIKQCFAKEPHFKVHAIFSVAAVVAGFIFRVSSTEWLTLLICIGSVLAAELFNTAIEQLCNVVSPGKHPVIKIVKDLSAAAVLLLVLAAIASGLIIFLPKMFNS